MKDVTMYFEEITQIPRPSGQEERIADYIEAFAREHGLKSRRDALHNVVVFRPAAHGRAGDRTVMLQGHTDIVPEKDPSVVHDFSKDPVRLIKEGDVWRADGTTLGADNGTAVALMLALLAEPSLDAPALECVFTSQEETGLFGAAGLDVSDLSASYLVNLDCGPEGNFVVGCAGGLRARIRMPILHEPLLGHAYRLEVSGLQGGHSGGIGREQASAFKLLARSLDTLRTECGARLVDIEGGSKDNVIPMGAHCIFACSLDPTEAVNRLRETFQREFVLSEPDLALALSPAKEADMLTEEVSDAILSLLLLAPYGVRHRSPSQLTDLETSSNLGTVSIRQGIFALNISIRSSVASRKWQLYRELETLCRLVRASCRYEGAYPGWAYEPVSPLRDKAIEVYKRRTGEDASWSSIHGGLECGLLKEKMPGLDAVALGVNGGDAHSPKEWVSISSLQRTYEYLVELLQELH